MGAEIGKTCIRRRNPDILRVRVAAKPYLNILIDVRHRAGDNNFSVRMLVDRHNEKAAI